MKKWGLSAVIYLLLIVGGYYLYASFIAEDREHTSDSKHREHATEDTQGTEDHEQHQEAGGEDATGDDGHGHAHENKKVEHSEVIPTISSQGDRLTIELQDRAGKPVTDLAINHEKLMHLIIVDEHLDAYYHLHPEQREAGVFEISHQLPTGVYKVFVDIKPKGLDYIVEPLELLVGKRSEKHAHQSLEPDKEWTKSIDGHTVTLKETSFVTNQPITLDFTVHNGQVEPYLGAMGHVVILDAHADEYIHVHPLNDTDTVFETEFELPGIYKLWAEFKIDGKVVIFPYVVEVK